MLFKPERFQQVDCPRFPRKPKDITVPVSAEFLQSLNTAFPVHPVGIQRNTAENNQDIQYYIGLLIHEALNDKHDWFEVNSELLARMTNSDRREDIMRFIRESGHFALVRPPKKDMWCSAYSLNETVYRVRQHNGCCPLPCSLALPSSFRLRFDLCFRSAAECLWKGSQDYVRNILAGLERLMILDVPDGFAEQVAEERLRKKGPKKRNKKTGKSFTREELIAFYLQTMQDFRNDPTEGLKRPSAGRLYSRMVNLPKLFRMLLVRVRTSRGSEPSVELDLSTTNPVCLAKILLEKFGPTPSVMRFVQDVCTSCSGDIYDRVCAEAGGKFAGLSREEKKRQFQIHCFFDKKARFGLSPLFRAFRRLYPEAGEFVLGIRRLEFGEAALSAMFGRIEARFFIDLAMPALIEKGMPPTTAHDALKVAESEQVEALNIMNKLAGDYFGFMPRIKPSLPPKICVN
jgi:hypothetical protein